MNQLYTKAQGNQFLLVAMAGFIVLLGVCSVGWQALQPVAPGPIQIGAVPPAPPFITEEGIVLQRWPTIETPQMLPTDRLTAVNGVPLATIAYDLFGRTFDRSQIAWQEGVTQQWTVLRDGEAVTIDVTPSPNPIGTTTRLATIWPQYLLVLLPTILTALIYWRQPRHASTPPLLLFGVSASVWLILSTQQMRLIYFFEPFAYFAFLIPHWLLPNLGTSAVCHLMCVFPQPSDWFKKRQIPLLLLIYGLPVIARLATIFVAYVQTDNGISWFQTWFAWRGLTWRPQFLLLLPVIFFAWRRSRQLLISRQQFRIFVASLLLFPIGISLVARLGQAAGYGIAPLAPLFTIATVIPFVGIYIAISQYRLFEMDRLLNRSMVYGLLTVLAAVVYAGMVAAGANLLQARGPLPAAIAATAIIAVLLLPVRNRAQKLINRLMYGQRDDPFEVLNQTAKAFEQQNPATALQQAVDTIGRSLRLPYVHATIKDGPSFSHGSAESNHPTWQTRMGSRSAEIGTLTVMQRDESTPFTITEVGLLQNIAQQAGNALHANRLTAQLKQTHQQLITARDDERKRIQRDLHDGLGPTLASMSMRIDAAQHLVAADPQKATDILGDLRQQTQGAVKEVRHLMSNSRPATLDELGLLGALEATIAKFSSEQNLTVTLETSGINRGVSAEIENTIYHIVNEGLTNVLRHAKASAAVVKVLVDDQITVTVTDNGIGIDHTVRAGIGVASLQRRLAQLNGQFTLEQHNGSGTHLVATMPRQLSTPSAQN